MGSRSEQAQMAGTAKWVGGKNRWRGGQGLGEQSPGGHVTVSYFIPRATEAVREHRARTEVAGMLMLSGIPGKGRQGYRRRESSGLWSVGVRKAEAESQR